MILKNTTFIFLNTINRPVFVMEAQPVHREVGTEMLCVIGCTSRLAMTEDKRANPRILPTDVTLLRKSEALQKTSTVALLHFSYFRRDTFPLDVSCFWKTYAIYILFGEYLNSEKLVHTVGILVGVVDCNTH